MDNPEENDGSGAIVWAVGLLALAVVGAITGWLSRRFS